MPKSWIPTFFSATLVLVLCGDIFAGDETFRYPCYLLEAYNPDDDCWKGMDANGYWPVNVVPVKWLVGPPPSAASGVTVPRDHRIELKFLGRIIDGPGDDILLIELGQVGEQALVFLTDGAGQEYLLGKATALNTGLDVATIIGFDISGISPPFLPCAVRIVALDTGGGSPGFDIANIRVRTRIDHNNTAFNSRPIDGAKNVSTDPILSWSPGHSADKHVVYFGPSLTDVDADATPVRNPAQPQEANSFDPGILELGKTYYWRIDELNNIDHNNVCAGDIWHFTVIDFLTIDDFESYNNNDNILNNTWEETGEAFIYISSDSARKCGQSMAFDYYYYENFLCQAVRKFTTPQDWHSTAGKTLELFFSGNASNDTNVQMHLILSDGDNDAAFLYEDMTDIRQNDWHLWRIDLQNQSRLNPSNIQTISIGFSAGATQPTNPGRNVVYFDDIRLYPSRCTEQNRPDTDLNSDCVVNFKDLQEIFNNWLDRRYKIYPVSYPNAPLVWYRFDGNTNDSSGNGFHAESNGPATFVPSTYGQAISFNGYNNSLEITDAANLFETIRSKITIAFWQYSADSPHRNDTLCCSDYLYGLNNPAIAINLGCWQQPGRYNWDCGYPWSFDNRLSGEHRSDTEWTRRWNHWAFTKDADQGIMQIFLNGKLYNRRTGAHSLISGISSFEIGSGWYGGYDGLIDDFCIFDYVLSQREITYIATNGTGIFNQPLLSPADLYVDEQINFKDFAVFASHWLDE
jgi:hypothetical protein